MNRFALTVFFGIAALASYNVNTALGSVIRKTNDHDENTTAATILTPDSENSSSDTEPVPQSDSTSDSANKMVDMMRSRSYYRPGRPESRWWCNGRWWYKLKPIGCNPEWSGE